MDKMTKKIKQLKEDGITYSINGTEYAVRRELHDEGEVYGVYRIDGDEKQKIGNVYYTYYVGAEYNGPDQVKEVFLTFMDYLWREIMNIESYGGIQEYEAKHARL